MIISHTQDTRGQRGSSSIVVIMLVIMAFSLSYGIIAVAETLIQKKEAVLGAQSSANAAAFVYEETFVRKMRECVKDKITEELDDDLVLSEECDADALYACLDSDFKNCELELSTCIPDEDEIVATCKQNDAVLGDSLDAANNSAHTIAQKYSLEQVQLSKDNETMKITARKQLGTQVPVFGQTGQLDVQAQSKFSLRQTGE